MWCFSVSDKRKKREFSDDIFELEDFGDVESILDYIMERLGMDIDDMSRKSFVSAFSVSNSQNSRDITDNMNDASFDDNDDSDEFESQRIQIKDPNPLIDIFEIDNHIHVMAEFPGIEKDDIELHLTVSSLEIHILASDDPYSEFVDLPDTVNPDVARATYKNGVLEVIMEKMEFGKARTIIIE